MSCGPLVGRGERGPGRINLVFARLRARGSRPHLKRHSSNPDQAVFGANARLTLILPALVVLACRDTKRSPAAPDHASTVGAASAPRDSTAYRSLARFDSLISHCDHSDAPCLQVVPEDSQLILSAGRAYRDSDGPLVRRTQPDDSWRMAHPRMRCEMRFSVALQS